MAVQNNIRVSTDEMGFVTFSASGGLYVLIMRCS